MEALALIPRPKSIRVTPKNRKAIGENPKEWGSCSVMHALEVP
jgi:hypothetical protein